MKIFYGRVSSKSQNLDRQIRKAKELGVEDRFVFVDIGSGKDFNRPKYQMMIDIIREGDLIILDALDRLGRDYTLIKEQWLYITQSVKADIIILENQALFDSRKFKAMDGLGKLLEDQFLSLLAYLADEERKKIRKRQKEGILIAQSKGVKFGRPTKVSIEDKEFVDVYSSWERGEITATKAHSMLSICRSNFYRLVNQYRGNKIK